MNPENGGNAVRANRKMASDTAMNGARVPSPRVMTDSDGNQSTYAFVNFCDPGAGVSQHETDAKFYQGPTTGTLLKTVRTDYTYNNLPGNNCHANVRPLRVTTILDDN